ERLAARLGRRCFFQLRQHAEKGLHAYNGNSQLPRPPGLATETVGVGGDHKFGEAADAAGNPESSPLTARFQLSTTHARRFPGKGNPVARLQSKAADLVSWGSVRCFCFSSG